MKKPMLLTSFLLMGLSVALAACANVPPAPPTPSPQQREQAALRKINIDLSEMMTTA